MICYKFNKPGPRKGRYVRKAIFGEHYEFCEQNAEKPQFDLAQGTCDAEDLPEHIRAKCAEHGGNAFYACEWPL